jgi:steroid 5-alpha reductase family enzyme
MLGEAVLLAVVGAGIVCSMMLALWAIHLAIKNAAIVDVGWAAGLGLLAMYYAHAGPGYFARKWMIAGMVGIWSPRLAGYLLFTRVIAQREEGRYVQLREDWATNLPL